MTLIRVYAMSLLRNSRLFTQKSPRHYMSVQAGQGSAGQGQAAATAADPIAKATGLSKNVLEVPREPVGPGAAKDTAYKNPEYFCYNTMSYFEAEVEMAKYRLPQPTSKAPLK